MSDSGVSKRSITNGKATASLILGVISIILVLVPFGGLILGIIGLILGIIGLREVKRLEQEGKKVALLGIVCSSLGTLIPIIFALVGYMTYMIFEATIS